METDATIIENAKQRIKDLVDFYNKEVSEHRVSRYNEETTKKDFILPLFEVLGWKTDRKTRHIEVTAEEKISKKRVDYGFRINDIPKFFLEAKSLKEDLDNPKFVEQAINYAWHKGCTWAVLTNFESVIIFNAEWKTSQISESRFITLKCHEFLDAEKFKQLWLLSEESFEQGLIDKEAEKWGKKTKKTPVNKQLWIDLTRFRESLSKDITKLNQSRNLKEEELDEAIQRILDRLIFIRNCEDKETEQKLLISNLRDWESRGKGQLIKNLRDVFEYFKKQYNSEIFAEALCDSIDVDNEVLHEIIEDLYYTKDKSIFYDFSAIEADVLGNVYEQYLGHILKKTEKRAKLTENHVHRKEQGIYYTPPYIVNYIVRNTLGELLKDKKVNTEKIRVLDPACGSGSFLIKAFDVLNTHHIEHDIDYNQTKLDIITGQSTPYTVKVKILENNIFGVDLDKQAVEITQLNLLLKIAEKGHRLPLLKNNIKLGHSLIDDTAIIGNKAFNWKDKFNEIMNEGGFDVIVGNPPWGAKIEDNEKKYYLSEKSSYISVNRELESHILFIELSLRLLKEGGLLGLILPNTWMYLFSTEPIREKILEECKIISIVELTKYIFADAPDIVPVVIILKKTDLDKSKNLINSVSFAGRTSVNDALFANLEYKQIKQADINSNVSKIFNPNLTPETKKIVNKIKTKSEKLSTFVETNYGIKTGDNEKYLANDKVDKSFVKCLKTKEIGRYSIEWKGLWLNYGSHLAGYRKDSLEVPKIIVQYTRKLSLKRRLICSLNERGKFYPFNNYSYIIGNEKTLKYIIGIINSKLMNFYFANTYIDYNIKPTYLNELPIRKLSKSSQSVMLISLVSKILSLNNQLIVLKDKKTDERARIEEEINKTDVEIDDLVYNLYGINESEKKVIEDFN